MALMEWLFDGGRIALPALAILVAELVLARWIAGPNAAAFAANALSGLGLLGALFAALTDLGTAAVAGFLFVGLVAHLVYLAAVRRQAR
jgi:hypothetical protein